MPAKIINKTKQPTGEIEFKDVRLGEWFDYKGYIYLRIDPIYTGSNTLRALEIFTNRAVVLRDSDKVRLLQNVEISYEETF